jgi:hypothetical protein
MSERAISETSRQRSCKIVTALLAQATFTACIRPSVITFRHAASSKRPRAVRCSCLADCSLLLFVRCGWENSQLYMHRDAPVWALSGTHSSGRVFSTRNDTQRNRQKEVARRAAPFELNSHMSIRYSHPIVMMQSIGAHRTRFPRQESQKREKAEKTKICKVFLPVSTLTFRHGRGKLIGTQSWPSPRLNSETICATNHASAVRFSVHSAWIRVFPLRAMTALCVVRASVEALSPI